MMTCQDVSLRFKHKCVEVYHHCMYVCMTGITFSLVMISLNSKILSQDKVQIIHATLWKVSLHNEKLLNIKHFDKFYRVMT